MMSAMAITAWNGVADYGPLFLPVVVTVGAAVHAWRTRERRPGRTAEIVLSWFFAGVVGVGGMVVTASHVFFADATAEQIGFPAGNPFQFEVATANLAFAVLGLLCLRMRGGFWYATGVGFAVCYWGAAVGHFVELFAHDDQAPYNAGPILITDIGVPVVILVALWRLRVANRCGRE